MELDRLPRTPPTIPIRWLAVIVPSVLVAVLELLSDTVLDEALRFPLDAIAVSMTVLVIGLVFGSVLYRRIDDLTGTLRARNAELEVRGASARALNRVSVAIASLTGVDDVLQAVVTHARELLHADVAVLLLEGTDGRLELRAAAGTPGAFPSAADDPAGSRQPSTTDPRDEPGEANPADAILAFVAAEHARVRLSAPLQRGGQTIGLLAIGAATARGFDADEVETLSSLANQATIALEHARLEARLRELAVVEERERIARELHDGIAQVLGYVNTKSQAIDGYLAGGHVTEARTQVAELGSAARAVYVDVREAILGLRSPIEPGQGLGAAVEGHARRVAADSRFALDLDIPADVFDLRLDPDAEGQVYRIVQEALTNVRKHAGADRIRVVMAVADGMLDLLIEDDGRGLGSGAAATDVPHYGLRSMRERAASIGAVLEVGERRAGGVSVRMSLPLSGHERVAGGIPSGVAVGAGPGPAGPGPSGRGPSGRGPG